MKRSIALLVVFSVLAACGPKADNRPVPISRAPRGPNPESVQGPGGGQGGGGVPTAPGRLVGAIFSQFGASLTDSARRLVSATMNPEDLGEVSGDVNSTTTGIRFVGTIRTNAPFRPGTALQVAPGSEIRIDIWDSYAADGAAPAYPITFVAGQNGAQISGSFTSGVNLMFRDQHGTIEFRGSVDGSNMYSGTVLFQNLKNYDGSTGGAAETLGQFRVPACGFFVCQ